MSRLNVASLIAAVLAAGGFLACKDDAPVAPGTDHQMMGEVASSAPEQFTFRAPLDPYTIQQLPDFMIHEKARTDIVFQKTVLSAASPFGMWHTHPGPSFVYVIEGQTKLQRFDRKDGCTETQVFGPGSAYFEPPDQIHRAVVVSAQNAVIVVTRFNIPAGQPFTIPVNNPGC
ncbi:MAG TPA: cupin domain-containing protein [Gemmatimonadales bacterium]|nr:cupin domain-containing protein [Gemmatimonadales bacterium]